MADSSEFRTGITVRSGDTQVIGANGKAMNSDAKPREESAAKNAPKSAPKKAAAQTDDTASGKN